MQNYTLYDEFITLGQVLKELGLIATGGQAKLFLATNDGEIFYNHQHENRRGKKFRAGDLLEIPVFGVSVKFVSASADEIAQHEEDKSEEARVKTLVKQMNAENKVAKPAKKSRPKSPGRH